MNWVSKIIKIQFLVIGGGSILLHGNEESLNQLQPKRRILYIKV